MIAVIFEVQPHATERQAYFDEAQALAPLLRSVPGFISVERFESLTEPGKFLSLSFWRDEVAVAQWRNTAEHRRAQALGRQQAFADYRLRVAEVRRDYGSCSREQVPRDSRQAHDGHAS